MPARFRTAPRPALGAAATKEESMDFDRPVNRYGTNSAKYDSAAQMRVPEGLIPMWVADMDFRVPDPVTEALHDRVDHGIYGYTFEGDEYFEAVAGWFTRNFDFKIDKKWIVCTPGVVFALNIAVRAFTEEDDAVLISRPVYYPFSNVIINNGRRLISSPLVLEDGHYHFDFNDFEQKIIDENVKMYILCSPHNPVSRVWTRDELEKIAEICAKHDVIVVSDEIHCDFVWPGHEHTVFHKAAVPLGLKHIICTAPSKSFNLAGLQASNIIIPDREMRAAYRRQLTVTGVSKLNTLGITACRAAYENGQEWLDELREYIYGNILFTRDYLKEHIPQVKLIETEGTYLLWLDFSELGLSAAELDSFIQNKAGLWLDGGSMFGEEGNAFQRVNAACTRATLEKALKQLAAAVNDLK